MKILVYKSLLKTFIPIGVINSKSITHTEYDNKFISAIDFTDIYEQNGIYFAKADEVEYEILFDKKSKLYIIFKTLFEQYNQYKSFIGESLTNETLIRLKDKFKNILGDIYGKGF